MNAGSGEMSERPFFSVIVPSYGRNRSLERCLQALLAQDYPADRLEVVVVDDGSPQPVALPGEMRAANIKVIRQANAGPAAARNAGAAQARGTWLAFTDDDCAPAAKWLAHLAEQAAQTPLSILGGRTRNGLPVNVFAATSQLLIDFLYQSFAEWGETAVPPFVTSNNLAVRADLFAEMEGFAAGMTLAAGEDREFCWRWQQGGGEITAVPGAIVNHYHDLTWRSFWQQHFHYGQGAWDFHRRRGKPARPAGWRFYGQLLAYPWRVGEKRPFVKSVLLAVSQLANAAGFIWQRQANK